jgi:hypothetical protein
MAVPTLELAEIMDLEEEPQNIRIIYLHFFLFPLVFPV